MDPRCQYHDEAYKYRVGREGRYLATLVRQHPDIDASLCLLLDAWNVYYRRPVTDDEVERELRNRR